MSRPDPDFWCDRRVLVTGHTGFKGAWLVAWLTRLGARVHGVSLPQPPTSPSLWQQLDLRGVGETRCDISERGWHETVSRFRPQVVLHLAAQSLVSVGYERPSETFRTNVQGTAEVLAFADASPSVEATLVVTTDKVYDPSGPVPHAEDSSLGGRDPYAASKVACEWLVRSWPRGGAPVATARAGNVIGGGDWATDRLVPDMVRAWTDGHEVVLRMPDAVRPWQHVLDPLAGYLVHAEGLVRGTELPTLNFGPSDRQVVRVSDVVEHAADVWAGLRPADDPRARTERRNLYETHELRIDSSRADELLGWRPTWDWRTAVLRTIEWYVAAASGGTPRDVTFAQIEDFTGTRPDG